MPEPAGLFGGAFDPPHDGHVALVRAAIERFRLARVVVVVTGDPPHKDVTTDRWTRAELARAAFEGLPRIEFAEFELERAGPSYTVDTVRWAAERWGDVIFLVGADEFAEFLSWREPDAVLAYAELGVATRPGFPRERLERVLAALSAPDRVHFFEIPALPISSRQLRETVAKGESIAELVPPPVAALIAERGLYRCYPETSDGQGRSTS